MLVQKQEPGRRIACGVSRRDVTGSGHFSRGGPGGPEPYVGARPGQGSAACLQTTIRGVRSGTIQRFRVHLTPCGAQP